MFEAKSVVITGAGGGLGRELVFRFATAGARVFASDINEEALAKLAIEAGERGLQIDTHVADVTDPQALEALFGVVVGRYRYVDFWINNAGTTLVRNFLSSTPEEFQRIIDVNLSGTVFGTRVALRSMEKRGAGTIVNIASVAGHLPSPFMSAYTTAKHAIVGFTRALMAELDINSSPVKIVLVSPGFVDTAIIQKGQEAGFPSWLNFLLARPETVAGEILDGLRKGHLEIFPTWNGRVMRKLYGFFPRTTVRSSRLLFTRSLKDAVLRRFDIPHDLTKPDL